MDDHVWESVGTCGSPWHFSRDPLGSDGFRLDLVGFHGSFYEILRDSTGSHRIPQDCTGSTEIPLLFDFRSLSGHVRYLQAGCWFSN